MDKEEAIRDYVLEIEKSESKLEILREQESVNAKYKKDNKKFAKSILWYYVGITTVLITLAILTLCYTT